MDVAKDITHFLLYFVEYIQDFWEPDIVSLRLEMEKDDLHEVVVVQE